MTTRKAVVKKAVVKKAVVKKAVVNTQPKSTKKAKPMSTETETPKAETEAKTLTPVEMCKQMHTKGMDEDAMITALTEHAGLSIIKAVAAYKKFLKESGLVQTAKEKKEQAFGIIESFVNEDGTIKAVEAIEAIMDEMDLSKGASRGKVKAYCKENDLEMPKGASRTAVVATDEQKDFIIEAKKAGGARKAVVASIIEKWKELDDRAAARMFSKVCKEAGLTGVRATSDHSAVIAWYKEHGTTIVTKTGLSTALLEAFPEMSPSASKRYFGLFEFAKQFIS